MKREDIMRPRILAIDDNEVILRMVQARLVKLGYSIEVANGGREAIEMLKSDPNTYDLVLLDQHMPDMDGMETLHNIREQVDPHLPVIMITASGSLTLAVAFMKYGGNDFIEKPIDFDILAVKIEQLTKIAKRLRDETKKRELAEEMLRQTNLELQARNEDLDAFAHMVAHDLQSPLAYMIGFASILTEYYATDMPDEAQGIVKTIAESGNKMSNITKELLLLASVRQETAVSMEPLDMAVVVDDVIQRLSPMINEFQAEIVLPDYSSWPMALGYAPWVEEVWVNYLSNAIKYGGRPPHVELGATVVGEDIRFWVSDNGEGLTPEDMDRLFSPFTRISSIRVEGHGLGLSIVARIVKHLDGEVGIESVVGEGSLFYFTLASMAETMA